MAERGYASADDQIRWTDSDAPVRQRRWWHSAAVFGLLVAIATAAAALASELSHRPARVLRVTSGSMQPTLAIGQQIHVDASAYASTPPHIGDVVAFHAPSGATPDLPVCGVQPAPGAVCTQATAESDQIFVKRVVAEPGDTIAVVDGSVWRDGEREREPFAATCDISAACNFPVAVRVPAGHWFLMGDNRGISDDSRSWGPVPRTWIIGKVVR